MVLSPEAKASLCQIRVWVRHLAVLQGPQWTAQRAALEAQIRAERQRFDRLSGAVPLDDRPDPRSVPRDA